MTMKRLAPHRKGTTGLTAMILISLAALAVLIALLVLNSGPKSTADVDELLVFCAAGMRYPMERIVDDYKKEYDIDVHVQYAGSNTLLSQIEVGNSGDLFLAADSSYIRLARQKGLAAESIPLATMRLVIAVRKDAHGKIASIDDLLQPDVRVACGNPGAAACGKRTKALLEQSGHWNALRQQINESGVFKPTVNDIANDVKLGSVDAGIVWDTTTAQYPELESIDVPEFEHGTVSVDIAVLNSTKNATASLRFARFVGARDRGLKSFEATHFNVVQGDAWEEVPEITFFVGSVNRRALEPIIEEFKKREGVVVNTSYNGCGILTGQMKISHEKGSGFPDTYMACDVYYLETVKDWFQDAVNVSDTDIVIAIEKGNPKEIHSLQDLLKPGLRVVIGQPQKCTIGVLTQRLLQHEHIYDKLMKSNVVSQSETSALLIPAVTTKAADAVLAYRTDTLAESDKVDVVQIDSDLAKAIQPYSIARSSDHKYLGRRLFQAIARSRHSFEQAGFNWRLDGDHDKQQTRPSKSFD